MTSIRWVDKGGGKMKIKKSISLSKDTTVRLIRHAEIRHTTVSQLITDWVWNNPLPEEIIVQTKTAPPGSRRP